MKIICVGRNYVDHAKELNNPVPDEPVLFMKPDTALLRNNEDFYFPEFSKDIHYECELVFRINREGKYIKPRFALGYIDGVGLGIDFTARDLQTEAKKKGLPWLRAKAFNHSAPVSKMLPPEDFPSFKNLKFTLEVNGEVRQQGFSGDMMFDIEYLITHISQMITLKKGDLIFTGTPKGVGPVKVGDHLVGKLGDKELLNFYVR